jgi:hypothetical protein
MKTSSIFSLNWRDFVKGLIIAIIGAVVGLITASVESGSLNFDWVMIGKTALLTAIAYITKNLLTNNKDEFLAKDK